MTTISQHYLKIEPRWFERVKSGEKRAEIRKHDRDYQVGDDLILVNERGGSSSTAEYILANWDDVESVTVSITHVLPSHLAPGLIDGMCVLSVELVEK